MSKLFSFISFLQIGERQYRTLVKELITNNLIHKVMKTTINHNAVEIKLSATFKGETRKWNARRYHFYIFVECNGVKKVFTFYDSVANYVKGLTSLSEDDLISAFRYILTDANCAYQCDLDGFCASLGYNKKEGKRIYNECLKSLDKLNKIGLSDNDITELLNSEQLEPYM